jgi:hypothetical protein
MAKEWLNKYLRMKPEVRDIFEDLEQYRQFCCDFGHVFDERHLYNERSPYGDMIRHMQGKFVRNHWGQESREPRTFQPRNNNQSYNRNYRTR